MRRRHIFSCALTVRHLSRQSRVPDRPAVLRSAVLLFGVSFALGVAVPAIVHTVRRARGRIHNRLRERMADDRCAWLVAESGDVLLRLKTARTHLLCKKASSGIIFHPPLQLGNPLSSSPSLPRRATTGTHVCAHNFRQVGVDRVATQNRRTSKNGEE